MTSYCPSRVTEHPKSKSTGGFLPFRGVIHKKKKLLEKLLEKITEKFLEKVSFLDLVNQD